MNKDNVERAMAALGVEPGTSESPGLQPSSRALQPGEERFNICRNRIHAIDFEGGNKVEEFKEGLKLRWLAFQDGQPRELGYLEVEKWLSSHCQIVVKPATEKEIETISARQALTIRYIDRSELPIERIGGLYFRIEGKLFQSKDFADAIEELRQLAQFK
jgi:hypothetical protein